MSETILQFADDFRGVFKLESTSIDVREQSGDVSSALDLLFSRRKEITLESLFPRFDEKPAVDLEVVSPALTYIHEQDHLKVLSSTPVGLLLWRIEQCLSVDVFYLKRKLGNVDRAPSATLLDALVGLVMRRHRAGVPVTDAVPVTASGAVLSRHFLHLLLARPAITVGEFIDTANDAFMYLALRSGLEPGEHARWASRLSRDQPLLTPEQPTLLEIIEASARARELTNLIIRDVDQPAIDRWQDRAIFGVYAPAFNRLMMELGSAATAKTAVDMALSTPIDLCAGDAGDILYVEDVLPSHRLERIISALRKRLLNIDMSRDSGSRHLYEEVMTECGFPSAHALYERLAGQPLSLDANWGGRIINVPRDGAPVNDLVAEPSRQLEAMLSGREHLEFVEQQYRRNFSLRVDNAFHFTTSQNDTLHEPILTFFKDRLIVSTGHLAGNIDLAFAAFNHFHDREVSFSYVFGGEADELPHYERLFKEWCLGSGLHPAEFDAYLELRSLKEASTDESLRSEVISEVINKAVRIRDGSAENALDDHGAQTQVPDRE